MCKWFYLASCHLGTKQNILKILGNNCHRSEDITFISFDGMIRVQVWLRWLCLKCSIVCKLAKVWCMQPSPFNVMSVNPAKLFDQTDRLLRSNISSRSCSSVVLALPVKYVSCGGECEVDGVIQHTALDRFMASQGHAAGSLQLYLRKAVRYVELVKLSATQWVCGCDQPQPAWQPCHMFR